MVGGVMPAASLSGPASPASVDGGCRAGSSFISFPSSGLLSPSVFSPRSLGRSRRRNGLRCSGGTRTPDSGPGDNDSKTILEAFFLGKAFAEALNERIESTVGEFLSVVGQWQAQQQKQVHDFQYEVIERAKRAKEKAAMQTIEEQGIVPKSITTTSNGSISTVSVSPSSPSPNTEDPV